MSVWVWLPLAMGTAVGETIRDLALRGVLRHTRFSTLQVIGLSSALSSLMLLPVLWHDPLDVSWLAFFAALSLGASLNTLAFWSYGRALAIGDLSLVLPLINLSPLPLLLAGWWLLGERPGPAAVIGILLLVSGALLLGQTQGTGTKNHRPLGQLWTSPGCRAMLLVAFLWGISASVDKLGVLAGGSVLWVLALQGSIATSLLGLSLRPSALSVESASTSQRWFMGGLLALLLAGASGAAGTVMQMEAIQQTAVVHVIAIKRLSTLMSCGAGVLVLGEPAGRLRLAAAALMVLGAASVLYSA